MPPEDRHPLEKLLDAAGRVVQPTHPGWQQLPERLARTPQQPPVRARRWWWLAAGLPLGLAAAAAVLWAVFGGGLPVFLPVREVQAEEIRVERLDVELTVLSVAATEGETLYMPLLQKLGRQLGGTPVAAAVEEVLERSGRRAFLPGPRPQTRRPTGQALVKDHRVVHNLQEGDNVVRYTDVAASIDPTSVRFVSHTDPEGTQVVEQNFEYDLASADSLLKKYLDREVTCVGKDGTETTGYLASFDAAAIVLASAPTPPPGHKQPRKTQTLAREALLAVRLNEVPKGLLTRPTLVWKIRARKAGKHDTTLSYLCGLVQWQADYVVVVNPGRGLEPDRLDVTGWVTLENRSGATYEQARLKLIAGDVNRVRDPWAPVPRSDRANGKQARFFADYAKLGADKEFIEKSFFEYHLYTLTAPSTVRDRQVKQLKLLQRGGVKADRLYVFDPGRYGPDRVAVELAARNDGDNGLGLPLPKGRVALEQRDVDGETALLGRLEIDHTPVKEELKLRYGFAFDVTGGFRQVRHERLGPRQWLNTYEMRVRNHRTTPIRARAVARLGTNWTITQHSHGYTQEDYQTVHFDFTLKPNSEQVITYKVEYQQ